jgi:hypothetical protein
VTGLQQRLNHTHPLRSEFSLKSPENFDHISIMAAKNVYDASENFLLKLSNQSEAVFLVVCDPSVICDLDP